MEIGLLQLNKMKQLNEKVTILKYERDDETEESQSNVVDTFDQQIIPISLNNTDEQKINQHIQQMTESGEVQLKAPRLEKSSSIFEQPSESKNMLNQQQMQQQQEEKKLFQTERNQRKLDIKNNIPQLNLQQQNTQQRNFGKHRDRKSIIESDQDLLIIGSKQHSCLSPSVINQITDRTISANDFSQNQGSNLIKKNQQNAKINLVCISEISQKNAQPQKNIVKFQKETSNERLKRFQICKESYSSEDDEDLSQSIASISQQQIENILFQSAVGNQNKRFDNRLQDDDVQKYKLMMGGAEVKISQTNLYKQKQTKSEAVYKQRTRENNKRYDQCSNLNESNLQLSMISPFQEVNTLNLISNPVNYQPPNFQSKLPENRNQYFVNQQKITNQINPNQLYNDKEDDDQQDEDDSKNLFIFKNSESENEDRIMAFHEKAK